MSMQSEKGTHIYIVDDDVEIVELCKSFFRQRDYKVSVFLSAESALDQLLSGEHPDVVLTDLNLPNMSGLDFTKRCLELGISSPIILMTVTQSTEVAIEAIQLGAYDFIVKPIHWPQLQVSIGRALHLKVLNEDLNSLKTIVHEVKTSAAPGIIGRSPNFLAAVDVARRVANSSANILITGETGTGKELIAKFIHTHSERVKAPFVAINCSSIPESLLESELFGHAKGAFTGAIEAKVGLFEEASGGTIFLDEIGDLPLSLQAKLLRVVQERCIRRVGENKSREIDARVVSATHKNLMEEVAAGRFREDLFFRLNVIPIRIPALRERMEDILPLAEHFLRRFSVINSKKGLRFSPEAIKFLLEESEWRGNVRELENSVERAVVLARGSVLEKADIVMNYANIDSQRKKLFMRPENSGHFSVNLEEGLLPMNEMIQKYVAYAIEKNEGAKDRTAKDLGIDRKTLYRRLQTLGG